MRVDRLNAGDLISLTDHRRDVVQHVGVVIQSVRARGIYPDFYVDVLSNGQRLCYAWIGNFEVNVIASPE